MTTYISGIFPRDIAKILHSFFMLGALVCTIIGLSAVWKSVDTAIDSNLKNLHSWLGLMTVIILAQNYIFGVLHFLLGLFPKWMTEIYLPIHKELGTFTFIGGVLAVCTGIQYLTVGCESYNTGNDDPAQNYQYMPDGCKLANGVGVVVFIGMFFILFGIRETVAGGNSPGKQDSIFATVLDERHASSESSPERRPMPSLWKDKLAHQTPHEVE
jgi:hypothetical protein